MTAYIILQPLIWPLACDYGLTPRAADTASPWARRGGWSGKNVLPAVVVGRRRRAADALVGREFFHFPEYAKMKS